MVLRDWREHGQFAGLEMRAARRERGEPAAAGRQRRPAHRDAA